MEQHTPKPNGMAMAAMILGIIAIPTTCCIGLGLPLAAVGMIFALLSRRSRKMSAQAAVGFGLCLSCIILSIMTFISSFLLILSNENSKDMWNTIYNMDLDDFHDYLYDMLNEYPENNNGVSPNGNTPIIIEPDSNTV